MTTSSDNDPFKDSVPSSDDVDVDVEAGREDAWRGSDQDPVAALHDVESEAGDEAEVSDVFDMDQHEAHELGVNLDSTGGQEPVLD